MRYCPAGLDHRHNSGRGCLAGAPGDTVNRGAARAVLIALAEQAVQSRGTDDVDVLAGVDAAVDELQAMGAVQRRARGVSFTHPLLRTTALDLASPALVAEVAAQLLDQLDVAGGSTAAGTLVRALGCSPPNRGRTSPQPRAAGLRRGHRTRLMVCAGDLAEYLVDTATDTPDRAHWTHRLGTARFNELDRDEATKRLIEAADLYESCLDGASSNEAAEYRNGRAECLLLALRTDFTRSGQRRHPQLDQQVEELIGDESIARQWRARSAAILAEVSWSAPGQDRRKKFVDIAQELLDGVDEPLTEFLVHFATGWDRLAVLDLDVAARSFTLAYEASHLHADPWWLGGGLSRRGLVALAAGDPMAAIGDATLAAEASVRSSNWAEHGMAMAVRSVASTRLGRFADADNDTESTILSARRAEAGDPFLASLSAAVWRRAVRGDQAGVTALRDIGLQHQMYLPFAEFIAVALLSGVEEASLEIRPRWTTPRNGLSFRNLGFHLAQFDAAVIAGDLEAVDDLFRLFSDLYERGVRASHDWPTGIARRPCCGGNRNRG